MRFAVNKRASVALYNYQEIVFGKKLSIAIADNIFLLPKSEVHFQAAITA